MNFRTLRTASFVPTISLRVPRKAVGPRHMLNVQIKNASWEWYLEKIRQFRLIMPWFALHLHKNPKINAFPPNMSKSMRGKFIDTASYWKKRSLHNQKYLLQLQKNTNSATRAPPTKPPTTATTNHQKHRRLCVSRAAGHRTSKSEHLLARHTAR